MKFKVISFATLATILVLFGAQIVAAETPDLGLDASNSQPIDDGNLGGMRGKFVPANGQASFFGITFETQIQAQNGATEAAGYEVGVALKNGIPVSASTQTLVFQGAGNGTANQLPTSGITITVPLNNLSGGIKQTIQVAGQDNSAHNVANFNLTSTGTGSAQPEFPFSTPCSGCTVKTGSNGIDVSVDMPGVGIAEQEIGTSSLLQAINLDNSEATAVNTLTINMQEPNPGSVAGLSSLLQDLPVTFH
jgi:hypothetical protein